MPCCTYLDPHDIYNYINYLCLSTYLTTLCFPTHGLTDFNHQYVIYPSTRQDDQTQ